MSKYKTVPLWWYLSLLLATIAISLGITQGYDTRLSWWAFFVSLILGFLFYLPIGIIQASTNIAIGLNVLTEFIVGYIQPGKPMAMMLFKSYGYMAIYQGLGFAQDMKLGVYMKIPPRLTFAAQGKKKNPRLSKESKLTYTFSFFFQLSPLVGVQLCK